MSRGFSAWPTSSSKRLSATLSLLRPSWPPKGTWRLAYEDPFADPAMLGAIQAPVGDLLGSESKPFFTTSARYITDHVPNARVHVVTDVAHAAPLTHPEALAEALTELFSSAQQPA